MLLETIEEGDRERVHDMCLVSNDEQPEGFGNTALVSLVTKTKLNIVIAAERREVLDT